MENNVSRLFCTKRVIWTMPWLCPALRLKSHRLLEWFTAPQASSGSSSSKFICFQNVDEWKLFFAAGCSHINLLLNFICSFSGLDSLSGKNKSPGTGSLPLESVILSLQDLIFYFRPPEEELEHEEKQTKLRSLRNRQNLFQEEVISMLPSKPLALWVQEIISVLYSE